MTSRQDWYLRPSTQPEHQGRSEPVYKAGGTLAQDIAQKREAERVGEIHDRAVAKRQLVEAARKLGVVTTLEVLGDDTMWHAERGIGERDKTLMKHLADAIYVASAACAQRIDRFLEGR